MKLPKTFLPENSLDETIKKLESEEDLGKEPKKLSDFVLEDRQYTISKIEDLTYQRCYPNIKRKDIADGLAISYGSGDNILPLLDILKFQDTQTMGKNIGNMLVSARKYNNGSNTIKAYIMVKGQYSCFAYAENREIIDDYIEKFDFKEVYQ